MLDPDGLETSTIVGQVDKIIINLEKCIASPSTILVEFAKLDSCTFKEEESRESALLLVQAILDRFIFLKVPLISSTV